MVTAGRGGRVVNVTSVHEHVPLEGSAAYCSAKGGLGLLTKVMALELAPHGITANLVAPATVEGTRMSEKLTAERLHELAAATPMGRLVRPEDIARTIAFLASEDSGFTTGHYLPVNGGVAMD
jgi:3-oxoacyl-[acyl-carrier protein] reductase